MTPEITEHGWVLARLDAHAAGWLDEPDEQRLLAHLTTCDACRAEAEQDAPLNPEDLEAAQHLPPTLIANWKSAALAGFEREMVFAHLARCARCRRDLALLGHTPELSIASTVPTGHGEFANASHGTEVSGRLRGQRWIPWAVGGWAAAASMIAVTLALRAPVPEAPATMSPLGTTEPAIPDAAPAPAATRDDSFSRSDRVVRLASPERGAENQGVRILTLGPGENALRIVVEPLIDVAPDALILIQLLGAGGVKHAEIRVPHFEAVNPDRGVRLHIEPRFLESSEPLTLLASVLAATEGAPPEPEAASYRILFRRAR